MEKRTQRRTFYIVLAIFLIGLIGVVSAFWANWVYVDDGDGNINVEVGDLPDVPTRVVLDLKDEIVGLVPIHTQSLGENDIRYAIIPVTITWNHIDAPVGNIDGLTAYFNLSLTSLVVREGENEIADRLNGLVNVLAFFSNPVGQVHSELANVGSFVTNMNTASNCNDLGVLNLNLTFQQPTTVHLLIFFAPPATITDARLLRCDETVISASLSIVVVDGQDYIRQGQPTPPTTP